jgi:hypothetical protein
MSDPLSTQILCTADQQDEEPWRIERLKEVASVLGDLGILRLHDHEGTLSVHWLSRPKPEDLGRVREAWARQNELHSEHYVDGVLIEEFEERR